MRGGLVVFAALAVTTPGAAHAGRTFYGWLFGTEVMPERGAEIQTWVGDENKKSHEGDVSETHWWIGPMIGITDQVEIGFPVEIQWINRPTPHTNLLNYGAELRWRLVSQDPVDKPEFAPLVRVALKRVVIGTRDVAQPEADVVGSYEIGDLHVLADLGMVAAISENDAQFELHPGAGFSVRVYDELRLGAEVFSRIPLSNTDQTYVAAGPNVAWSHGRTWVSAAYGVGVYHIRDAPRINWGIAF